MKMRLLVCLCLVGTLLHAQSDWGQETTKPSVKDRLFTGGNVVLNFGTNTIVVGATPTLGYRITPKWSAGIGVTGLYYRFNFPGQQFSSSVYGGNLFTRFLVTDNFFLGSEFHAINTNAWDPLSGEDLGRQTIPLLYVGGGFRQQLGENVFLIVSLMYDVFDDPNSPFQNPNYGGGIIFGL